MNIQKQDGTVTGVNIDELDPGHYYKLPFFDCTPGAFQRLVFVKRQGVNYPGNTDSYPGTTLQCVLRACAYRVRYLNGQQSTVLNVLVLSCLLWALWLLEFRAARRKGRFYWHSLRFAGGAPLCPTCGHTDCHEHQP